MSTVRYYGLSMLSGCAWGALGYVLSRALWPQLVWAPVAASPLIGLGMGWLFRRVGPASWPARMGWSLATLYLAVAMFGLAAGLYDALRAAPVEPAGGGRVLWAVVVQAVLAAWWGVTFTGLIVVLWPLSLLNHSLVCWLGRAREPA